MLTLEDIQITAAGTTLGPLNFTIAGRKNLGIIVQDDLERKLLIELLSGARDPSKGRLIEPQSLATQSDTALCSKQDWNISILDFMGQRGVPRYIMLDKRRPVEILLDNLEIDLRSRKRPLIHCPNKLRYRFIVFKLLLSDANLRIFDQHEDYDSVVEKVIFSVNNRTDQSKLIFIKPSADQSAFDRIISLD